MLNKLKSSKSLGLSFDFEILKHENRTIDLKINKLLRKIKYSDRIFYWFMEDLVTFLDSNKYQRRWDYGLIIVHGIETMNFNKENTKKFILKFKEITSWDMEAL